MTTSSQPAVIHIVDDDASFRRSISRLLKASSFEVVVHETAKELIESPPTAARGCILLDVRMPDLDGFEVQNRLSVLGVNLPIVFLTGHGDIAAGVRAIKAGAEDFLPKPVKEAELFDAIQRALARYDDVHKKNRQLEALRVRVASLTRREREVFTWVIRGKLNKQIAYELGAAERTIKVHRHNMMLKLGVRSVAEAVSMAERLGLLSKTMNDGEQAY